MSQSDGPEGLKGRGIHPEMNTRCTIGGSRNEQVRNRTTNEAYTSLLSLERLSTAFYAYDLE